MLLACGVMATVAAFVVGSSTAFLTADSSNPSSTFGAADLRINQSTTGELLDGSNLKPGATRSGTVVITNAEHKAKLTLGVSGLNDTPPGKTLANVIRVVVRRTSPSPATVYDGKLSGLKTVPLGTLANGDQHEYAIDIRWPQEDDDLALAGVTTSFVFEWMAQSVQ